MLDMFNPALREAKRRARAEYRHLLLQGKIDQTMRNARERAARKLASREKRFRDWQMIKPILLYAGLVLMILGMMRR